jgi:hypothetical protein
MMSNLWTQEEDVYLINNYGKITFNDMLESYLRNRDFQSIANRCQRLSRKGLLKTRPRSINKFNKTFFDSITPLSSYWAGFLAGDGYINERYKTVSLSLAIKDEGHLKQLCNDVDFEGKLVYYKVKERDYVRFIVYSNDWVRALNDNFNVTPNKTFSYTPPSFTSEEHVKAFLSGDIDADGNIYFQNYWYVRLLGSFNLMVFTKKWFDKWAPRVNRESHVTVCNNSIYKYHIGGSRAEKILSKLLEVDVPRLKRKWAEVDSDLNRVR